MLPNLLIGLVLNSLFIVGLYSVCRYELNEKGEPVGLILSFVGFYSEKWLGFISKPLFCCVVCMSSVWGTMGYWILDSLDVSILGGNTYSDWIIYIFCLAGINSIYARFID